MLYSIKDREGLEKLEELASLQNQVNVVRLQNKLGKQNFLGNVKKVFEPITKSLEKSSKGIAKAITETFKENNFALENLNNKLVEIMNDRGIVSSYLLSPLS